MRDDSAARIEVALRAAHLAKSTLELTSVPLDLARLQISEIAKELRAIDRFLEAYEVEKVNKQVKIL